MSLFDFYADTGLTALATPRIVQKADELPVTDKDGVIYLGSTDDNAILQAESDPGVDSLFVEVLDSSPGTGPAATSVKLALSSGGLTTAVAGDPLELPATIEGGLANVVAIHYRVLPQTLADGEYDDLTFSISGAIEYTS